MKKIKYLLGIGILGTLFSTCFGYENFNRAFGTYTDSVGSKNFYTSFSLSNDNVVNNGVGNENGNVLPLNQSFSTNQSAYPQESRYIFYESRTINHLFDSLGGSAWVTSWNIGGFTVPGTSPSYNVIINGTGDVLDFNYLHLFYNQGSSLFDDYFFLSSMFLYNMSGNFQDIPSGLGRKKVLPGLNLSYSSISIPNKYSSDYSDDYFQFSFVPEDGFQDGSLYNKTGIIVLHFNTYSNNYLTGLNTIVLFKDDSNIYYNLYNEYIDSLSILSSINPISKGILYSYGGGNGFNDFKNMVFDSGLMLEVSGSPSNGLIFKSIDKQFIDGHLYNEYHFTFTENNGVLDWGDFINGGGGGGNNNSGFPDSIFNGGIFDANTYLIEESIKCYLTSGEVCNSPFTYEGSENYVNLYSHGPRYRNSESQTGTLTFNNSVDMLNQYCLNTSTIQYSFCSQLDLYEGYPITYYYNNGYFNYYVFGSGFTVNLGVMWSGQLGYAYCEGPNCSNINEGLPIFIKKDTGDYSAYGFSGEYVSLDFFKHYFDDGFFFQCPFSYSGSYFTIGSKLIDRLDSHDPLKPINCFIAAFSHGIKSSFFGDSSLGLSHSGTFMKNTGPNASRFYTFLDVLICLGYIFLFSKLFKFLKKH